MDHVLFENAVSLCNTFSVPSSSVRVLVHARNSCILLQRILVVVRTSRGNTSVHLLESSQVHGRIEQGKDVRVESFPVGIVQVVLLGLWQIVSHQNILAHNQRFG